MSSNMCDGRGGCNPVFRGTTHICYRNKDACDYPDTACTGTLAACSRNALKPLTGTPVTLGSVTLQSLSNVALSMGPVNRFNTGFTAALSSSGSSVNVELNGYRVPCGTVAYTAVLYRLTSSTTVPGGGVVVSLSNGAGSVRTTGASNARIRMRVDAAFVHNNIYRIQITAENVRGNSLINISPAFLIDLTPPILSTTLYDGIKPTSEPLFQDEEYQTSVNSLSIHWKVSDLNDNESGLDLTSLEMAVGTSGGSSNTQSYQRCASSDLSKGQCTVNNLNLRSGVRYYSTLRVANNAGVQASFSTNGIVPDTSPPNAGQLSITLPQDLSGKYLVLNKATLQLDATLQDTADQQSGVGTLEWQLCDTTTAPTVCSTQGFQNFNCPSFPCTFTMTQPSDRITTARGLIDGHSYEVQVRVINNAGLTSQTSDSFRVDLSPPTPGVVNDGAGSDLQYQSSLTTLIANWNGFMDASSGIHHYESAAFNFDGDDSSALSSYSSSGLILSATASELSLTQAKKYRICVRAVDNANNALTHCSNGITIDSLPPAGGEVLDVTASGGAILDIDYQADPSRLRARWQGFAALSGISSYMLGIGTRQGLDDVISFAPRGLTTTGLLSSLTLQSGSTYYAVVKSTSRTGVSATVSSDGIRIDTSPPTVGQVWDLCTNSCGSTQDVDFTGTNTKLSLRWSGFMDVESNIKEYRWNYAYCGESILLHASDFVADLKSEDSGSVALTTAVKYCLRVQAINKAGLSSVAWSDGVLVDITPPSLFRVADGSTLSDDIDHQSSQSALKVTWSELSDEQSQISMITVAAGTAPGSSNVVPAMAIDVSFRTHTLTSLTLTDLTEYYMTVCSFNNAGLSTCVTTDGVLIDVTAPTAGIVLTGEPLLGQLYQSNTSFLVARWSAFEDVHSDVREFQVQVADKSSGSITQPFTSVGLRLEALLSNLMLQSGETYTVKVQAVNYAGLSVDSRSAGITIDSTPPTFQQKPELEVGSGRVLLSWTGVVDKESSVWYYRWAIGVSCEGNQVAGYTNVANTTDRVEVPATLITGQVYYGTVVARNRAGVSHAVCSDPMSHDGTPPVIEQLTVGDGTGQVKYVADSTSIHCSWSPVTDHESGVESCQLEIVRNDTKEAIAEGESQSISGTSSSVNTESLLVGGQAYQCRLSCKNGVGLSTTSLSTPVTLDISPPLAGEVVISPYWSSLSHFASSWTPCTDSESGVVMYEWSLGTLSSEGDISPITSVGQSLSGSIDGLSLSDNSAVVVRVTCKNGAGLTTSFSSSTVQIDATPPQPSPSVSLTTNPTERSLTATWLAAKDDESGISGYRWAIGVSPGGSQVMSFTGVGDVLSATCLSCSLKAGEEYYVTIEATNGALLTASSISQGSKLITSDPSPGTVELLSINLEQVIMELQCSKFDGDPAVSSCMWELCNKTQVIDSGNPGCLCSDCQFSAPVPEVSAAVDDVTLLTLKVTCTDTTGRTAAASSLVDVTPPQVGQVKCSPFSSNTSHIVATWTKMQDPQSDVTLQWAIGHEGSSDILSWRSDGLNEEDKEIISPPITLMSGERYTITLESRNAAGLVSSATCMTTIDTTPPVAGSILDGQENVDMDYTSKRGIISASWSGFDEPESGPLTYKWCIGQSAGGEDVMTCRSVGSAERGMCLTCKLLPGRRYYATVLATNKAGLTTNSSSNGIVLDVTSPTSGRVYEGTGDEGDSSVSDDDYIDVSSEKMFPVFWTGFSDSESSISGCRIAVGRSSDGNTVWMRENVAVDSSPLMVDATNLPTGVGLVTQVSCVNGAGLWSMSSSDRVVLDATPPTVGTVSVKQKSTGSRQTVLEVSQDGFNDLESNILYFDIIVVNNLTQMVETIMNRSDPNTTFSVPVQNLTKSGDRVYAVVAAYNGVGLFSEARSPAIVIDTSPPSVGFVLDGPSGSADIDFSSSTTLQAHWEDIRDPDSGIKEFWYAIGTSPGGTQVLDYRSVGLNTSTSCKPSLCNTQSGVTYYTTVRAVNSAGGIAWFESSGVTIDTTAPSTVDVIVNDKSSESTVYASPSSSLRVTWRNATDYDSPLAEYSVCVSSESGNMCDLQPWSSAGLKTEYILDMSSGGISSESAIRVNLRARNVVDLSSISMSQVIGIDSSPPEKGRVIDGNGMVDVDCQDDRLPISAQWSGFVDKESYISQYDWAIGSQQFLDDVLTWTSVGLDVSAEVSSSILNQRRDMVYVTVRATNGAGLQTNVTSDGVRLFSSADRAASGLSEVSKLCVSYVQDGPEP